MAGIFEWREDVVVVSADGLVARLHAAIDETVKLVEARNIDGKGSHDLSWHTVPCGYRQREWQEDCDCDVPAAVLRLCQAHRDLINLFPVSAPHLDTEGSFYGFQSRDCGEHRTAGPHRAWCFDCSEWCYPQEPCRRCHGVSEVLRIVARGYGVEEQT